MLIESMTVGKKKIRCVLNEWMLDPGFEFVAEE